MASAVILTYERKASFNRNGSMKKKSHNGFSMDHAIGAPAERSYTSETMADSSDTRRSRRPSTLPCTAQNFTTKSTEQDPSETASEDSCSLKRKSMSVNGKSRNGGSGPSSFNGSYGNRSKDLPSSFNGNMFRDLSRDEKRQLRKKIKMDLQQVRSLSQRLQAREFEVRSSLQSSARSTINGSTTNGHYFPSVAESSLREGTRAPPKKPSVIIPDVNIESMSVAGKDKRTPKANQLYASSEFLSGKDKLPPPEKQKSKIPGHIAKRSFSGKLEDQDSKRQKMDFAQSRRLIELMKQCGAILKKLMTHKFAWVFNEPVNAVELGLHDYHKIIKKPMDLGTIKKKLDSGVYLLPTELCEDVRLTFANALKYNPQGHDVYHMAETLRGLFESKWKTIDVKVRELESAIERSEMEPKETYTFPKEQVLPSSSSAGGLPGSTLRPAAAKMPKQPSVARSSSSKMKSKPLPPPMKREMTFDEKQELSELLGTLPAEKLEQAVQIMRRNPNLMQTDDEIEVDIESFDIDTLWELHRFVLECSKGKQDEKPIDNHPAAFPEVSNGASRVPQPTQRGTDVGEEEVDIGDDMPAKEFPPVVIDKDKGANTKNSSSSSSSSGSGSSSSDSDSGSSSGSDSEADDGRSPGTASKISSADKEAESALPCGMSPPPVQEPPVGSNPIGDRRGGAAVYPDDGLKRSVNEENVTMQVDSSSQSEVIDLKGEASQDRQARVALMRSRFAETILKAQEKSLPMDKDPEKAKKDQEDLERRKKEEKARLQAEARANEIARKKAEVAAEAEAKRRRQAEREAARLALQNMEKTIEIGESMEVLKDLERLRSAPPENIPSSGDESSPVSNYALEGANPLERLGLFMRTDEEEEQEIDPTLAPCSSS